MNYHLLMSVLENYCLYFPDPIMPPIGGVGIIGDSSPIHIRKEIWDMYELSAIIKYESYKGNKAIISLLWNLDARSQDIALLKFNKYN